MTIFNAAITGFDFRNFAVVGLVPSIMINNNDEENNNKYCNGMIVSNLHVL